MWPVPPAGPADSSSFLCGLCWSKRPPPPPSPAGSLSLCPLPAHLVDRAREPGQNAGTHLAHTVDGTGEAVIGDGCVSGLNRPQGLTRREEGENQVTDVLTRLGGCLAPSNSQVASFSGLWWGRLGSLISVADPKPARWPDSVHGVPCSSLSSLWEGGRLLQAGAAQGQTLSLSLSLLLETSSKGHEGCPCR